MGSDKLVNVKGISAKYRILSGSSSCYNQYLVLGYLALSCRKIPKLVHKHWFCNISNVCTHATIQATTMIYNCIFVPEIAFNVASTFS